MSHVVSLKSKMHSLPALRRVCKQRGWQLHEGQHSLRWYGNFVDDSPVPADLFATEAEYERVLHMSVAQRRHVMTELLNNPAHVISVPGHDYDIGLYQVGDALVPIFDNWRGAIRGVATLAQDYAVATHELWAEENGYSVLERTRLPDGTLRLQLESNY